MPLSSEELLRYARHLVLPQIGVDGQERLRAASALVIGLGGLGSPAALYLAAAGVGRLGIVDHDTVAVHNLQRQVLHDTQGIGSYKTESARARLESLNPHVRVETWQATLSRDNARGIVRDYDVIVDGTDSFETRYLVNDACVIERRPNVHASVHRFEGQLSVFGTTDGPCYRCLHPAPPPPGSVPNCEEGGVLGVLPGLLGSLQAAEALKLMLGIGVPMAGRLLVVDALSMRFHEVSVERDPSCEWCGTREARELLEDYAVFCGLTPAAAGREFSIEPKGLSVRLARGDVIRLVDVREPWEHAIGHIEGSELIPMNAIPMARAGFSPEDQVVVYCHHGQRSAMVADYLRSAGVRTVLNLEGGIDRWSLEVDRSVVRY